MKYLLRGFRGSDVVTGNSERLVLTVMILLVVAALALLIGSGTNGSAAFLGGTENNVNPPTMGTGIVGTFHNPFEAEGGTTGGSLLPNVFGQIFN